MGKNKKHQKEVRKEKSKVQLKTKLIKTKFLPKGGNVSDVNFKIKQIVVREQLKSSAGDFVTKKHHNLKELLTRLNHYNTTMRYDACEGLIELIISSPKEVMEQNLHTILQGVSKLILDFERKVRQKAIKVLRVILEKVANFKVTPFFDILTSYVSCAMTHIDKNIQEDSLLVIDVYLEHIPDLVAKNFDKIFSNFLTLISKLRSDSNLSRTLTVNLGSKLTSIKWRIKVLSRLQGILTIVSQKQNSQAADLDDCKTVIAEGVKYIPLYRKLRVTDDILEEADSNLESKNETDYVQVLLPLLYETWAEAAPLDEIKYRENGAMLIGQDAASILSCIVGILCALMDFVKHSKNESDVRKLLLSKENKLLSHFLNQFSYRQHDQRRKTVEKELSKLLVINTDPKCVQENLSICYIFCILYKTFPNTYFLQKANILVDYINGCLSTRNYVPPNCVKTITLVLRIILFDNYRTWHQRQLIPDKLLDGVVNFYNNLPADTEQKMEMFNLLADVAKQPEIVGSPKFLTWLRDLPLLLLKPSITLQFVDTLSLLARQNNKTFLGALSEKLEEVLDNLPKIEVTNDGLPPAQIKLIGLLRFIPNLHLKHNELLQRFIKNNEQWKFVEHATVVLSRQY